MEFLRRKCRCNHAAKRFQQVEICNDNARRIASGFWIDLIWIPPWQVNSTRMELDWIRAADDLIRSQPLA
jgi:hypothetical protein